MISTQSAALYRVWTAERVACGPLELSALRQWIEQGQVTEQSWVLVEATNEWKRAGELQELKPFGASAAPSHAAKAEKHAGPEAIPGCAPEVLRRIKLFASLDPAQIAAFAKYLEPVNVPQFGNLIRKGQRGDAMYVVLEGELRALTIIEGKESLLATMGAGDCFGEISLLDQGPRSAEVIANRDSTLLKLSSIAFERLIREAPALAMPFVLALSRAVVERVRRTTIRYEDSIGFIRSSRTKR